MVYVFTFYVCFNCYICQDLLMKTTLDSIFKVGFGVELKTLSGTSEEGKAFAKAFDDSSIQVTRRFFDITWKVKRYLNVGAEAMMKKNIKIIDDFVYKLIDTKLKQLAEDQDDFVSQIEMKNMHQTRCLNFLINHITWYCR